MIRFLVISAALASGLMATGCAPQKGTADFRKPFPLQAERKTSVLTMAFIPGGGTAYRAADPARFRQFVSDYLRRGRSPMLVATQSRDGDRMGQAHNDRILAALVREGIPRGKVYFRQAPPAKAETGGGTAVFSFEGYVVKALDCGDWSGWAGFDPSNLSHTNFGCAVRRNMGLMLADPGDLVQPRGGDTNLDSQRSDTIIGNYRKGSPTGMAVPNLEEGVISDVQ